MSRPETMETRKGFVQAYQGTPPWEIDKPQPPYVLIADRVQSPLLDSGCGTGATALFFAERGLDVTGIDFVDAAIDRAKAKAESRGLQAEFLVKDAMTLGEWNRRFASVIDSGLFHIYAGEVRHQYVKGLAHILEPGGTLYLFAFAEGANVPGGGSSREELESVFSQGWTIESIELTKGEVNPNFSGEEFENQGLEHGIDMWFAIIKRNHA